MQTLIGMSIQSNSVQVSFNVFARCARGKIRTLLEGVLNPLGGVIGAITIILLRRWQENDAVTVERLLPFTGAAFSMVWLFAAVKIRKSYLAEAEKTARSGDERDRADAVEALQIESDAVLFGKKTEK